MNRAESCCPGISIVIPVYNAQDWIQDTLASVLRQTYPANCLEVIIIDDGSTDGSVAAAESVLRKSTREFRVIKTDNGGPSRARNIGWQCAKGEWIQFLDADDLLHPEKIAIQSDVACFLPSQVAVIYSDWQRLGRVGQTWLPIGDVVTPMIADDPVMDLLKAENFLQIGSPIFRRTWLEQVGGFDEQHRLIEDVELMLKIAMLGGKFHRVPTCFPIFFYRQQDAGSLSRHSTREFVEGCLRNAAQVESHLRLRDELTLDRAHILEDVYFQGARYFAAVDKNEFEVVVRRIEALIPNAIPSGPKRLRWLSRLIGYRRAERIAVAYRGLKSCLKH